ncbi:MAG: NUDIX hydrolase, partial [Gammaproteobacteria bacterium]
MSDRAHHVEPAQGDHELFDVVDDDDRVLGRMRRDDVHRWQLRHRAAHVLVVNSHGEVFVQRRSTLKECAPGLWDTSVAGHVQSGEGYTACAVRELAEEIGLPPATPLCQV